MLTRSYRSRQAGKIFGVPRERDEFRSTAATSPEEQFKAVNQYTFDWLKGAHETYLPKDFGWVFEKFIKS